MIQGEVINELARLAGVGDDVRAITEGAMRGELVRSVARQSISSMRLHGILWLIGVRDGRAEHLNL